MIYLFTELCCELSILTVLGFHLTGVVLVGVRGGEDDGLLMFSALLEESGKALILLTCENKQHVRSSFKRKTLELFPRAKNKNIP